MTAFFAAIVIGRLIGSRLSHTITPSHTLVVSSLVALLGFPLFWIVGTPFAAVSGLFLVGLGLGNVFPLTLALAVGLAPHNANAVSARASLGSGSAILLMPQALGIVADQTSIQSAYGVVLVMLVLVLIVSVLTVRQMYR